MRYFEANGDQLVLRESARDHLVRGAVWLFVLPWIIVGGGWSVFSVAVDAPSPISLALASLAIGFACAVPAFGGLFLMATAQKRAGRRATTIDLGERLISVPGREPAVFRKPDAVVVVRAGLRGWALRLEGETKRTLVRGVPHGGGRDLAAAADALAEALGLDATVPSAARGALSLVPHDANTWAALCYAPVDGVNLAYSLLALISSNEPRLRFAAKQSLVFFVLELFLAFMVSGCVGIPVLVASAPLAFEAAAFLCPIVVLFSVRSLVRLFASVRAYRGELWIMPWLAPLVRRWVPAE